MKSYIAITALASFVLVGCATGYEKSGLMGGFDDVQLAPDMFRIKFDGNGWTSPDRAHDFALLRAADLTIANGYSYFGIIDESNQTHETSFTTPATETTTGNVTVSANEYANGKTVYRPNADYYTAQSFGSAMANYNQTTTYTPSQTFTTITPQTGLLISCFKQRPNDIYVFDAAFLEKSLRTKYHLPPLQQNGSSI